MKVLALDYGTVRVGVAISFASLAQPLLILPNDANLLANIVKLIQEHHISEIVVGLSENQMVQKTKRFVKDLQTVTTLPITFIDETLTSYQVHQWLRQAPVKKR
ncbi:pre-16S rRNA-processing nuclease YqgF, partial [bacterium]|nr:pre-16S rRNA-processing nuclease YqgF [bacterium]